MFKFWRKSDIKELPKLEEELQKIKNKSNAQILAFIGVAGKIKGLNLISFSDNSINTKLFAGVIADLYQKIMVIEKEILNESLSELFFSGSDKKLFLSSITNVVLFVSLHSSKKDVKLIANWLESHKSRLGTIFSW